MVYVEANAHTKGTTMKRNTAAQVATNALMAELDWAENKARQADADAGKVEVRKSGDGWEVVKNAILVDGTTAWKRQSFSRDKAAMERAAARLRAN